MGPSRAVPLLSIFIPPHIHPENSTVIISTFPVVSFDTQAAFPCMYMSANYLVSTGLRATGFDFFLPFLLIVHLSVLATSFLCPIGLLCEYLELMLCDLHIEFRLCLTVVLYIRNTKRVKTYYCCLWAIKPIGFNTFFLNKSRDYLSVLVPRWTSLLITW